MPTENRSVPKVRVRFGDSVVTVSAAQAEKCHYVLAEADPDSSGSEESVTETPDVPAEGTEPVVVTDDTQEQVQDAPEAPEAPERPKAADVRKWASDAGVECNAKGKIPDAVYEQYLEAHKS